MHEVRQRWSSSTKREAKYTLIGGMLFIFDPSALQSCSIIVVVEIHTVQTLAKRIRRDYVEIQLMQAEPLAFKPVDMRYT